MIVKIIEFSITFIITWLFIVSYLRYDMNKELKTKGDVLFSNINIGKVQKTILFKNILHAYVNGERIKIIGIDDKSLDYLFNNKNVLVYTRMCVYGFILLHNGFKFYRFKH